MKILLDLFNKSRYEKKRKYILSAQNDLPSYIKALINEYNLEIYLISDKKMQELINDTGVLGFYLNNEKQQIYINECQDKDGLINTLYHELGHFIDKCIGDKLGKNDFNSKTDDTLLSCFNLEKEIFEFIYFQYNISEFFAQVIAEVFKNNKYFLSLIPTTNAHVLKLFEELNS